MRQFFHALLLVAITIQIGGCAQSQNGEMNVASIPQVDEAHAALVLPPAALISMHDEAPAPHNDFAWEYGRNDRAISYQPWSTLRPYGWTETYTRDRFNTHNGRLHDHSRFEIRSYQIR